MIQWYPGHMTRTFRALEKILPSIDVAAILLDARVPYSACNPQLLDLLHLKPKLYILNKADLADEDVTKRWLTHFNKTERAIAISSKNSANVKKVMRSLLNVTTELQQKRIAKGMGGMRTSVLICGIPNVGKSTLINLICGEHRAKTADKPGVTRGIQRISLPGFDLVDVPGLLWKRFENNRIAANLAFIGSINDEILSREDLATNLLYELCQSSGGQICSRYKLDSSTLAFPPFELLCEIGKKRGLLLRGGDVDYERAAIMVVDEFRVAKFGRISLEQPPD